MKTKQDIEILLEKLTERPIAFHPAFAQALGGVNEAILFQQLYYWSDKGSREDGFIYKTKREIHDETTLTIKQQDLARTRLKGLGVITTQLMKVGGGPVIHYKVDIQLLHKVILEYFKLEESSTSEITTKNTAGGNFKKNANADTEALLEWAAKHTGRRFANETEQRSAIKKMLRAKYSAEDIMSLWKSLEREDFWAEKGIDFVALSRQIGKKRQRIGHISEFRELS